MILVAQWALAVTVMLLQVAEPSPQSSGSAGQAAAATTPPSPAASANASGPSSSAPARAADSKDLAYKLIGGSWNCTTFGGTKLVHTFVLGVDISSIHVTTTFDLPNHRVGTIYESYAHSVSSALWTAVLADDTIAASAKPWTDQTWIFNGVLYEGEKSTDFRMIYTYLSANAFRRTFYRVSAAGIARAYAGETCNRVFASD